MRGIQRKFVRNIIITYKLSYDVIVQYNTEMFFIQSAYNLQRDRENEIEREAKRRERERTFSHV